MIATSTNPLSATLARRLIEAAGRAPSPDNNQPWAFRVTDDGIDVFHCRSRAVPSDVQDLFAGLAVGAAIENMVLEASRRNFRAEVEYAPRPFVRRGELEPVATIRLSPSGYFDSLSGFTDKRVTNRKQYRTTSLTVDEQRDLSRAVKDPSCEVVWLTKRPELRRLSWLVFAADRIRFEHQPFHDELHHMLRFGADEAREAGDGLELTSLEIPRIGHPLLRWLNPWPRMELLNRFGLSRLFAWTSLLQVRSSGAAGLLLTERRDGVGYVEAGRALQRIWLTAAARGLAFQPLGALPLFLRRMEVFHDTGFLPHHVRRLARVRDQFLQIFPQARSRVPAILFRVGRCTPPSARSYRLPVDAIRRD